MLLAALMLLMAVLTNILSNNAAGIIGTPIAISIAAELGLDPVPFVVAIIAGVNLSFATPMAYQTNLLVMHAGGYHFIDFVRVGAAADAADVGRLHARDPALLPVLSGGPVTNTAEKGDPSPRLHWTEAGGPRIGALALRTRRGAAGARGAGRRQHAARTAALPAGLRRHARCCGAATSTTRASCCRRWRGASTAAATAARRQAGSAGGAGGRLSPAPPGAGPARARARRAADRRSRPTTASRCGARPTFAPPAATPGARRRAMRCPGGVAARAAGPGRRPRVVPQGRRRCRRWASASTRGYGVFSPLRGEYVDLVAAGAAAGRSHAPSALAFDIGTGSGVLAAVLARRRLARGGRHRPGPARAGLRPRQPGAAGAGRARCRCSRPTCSRPAAPR